MHKVARAVVSVWDKAGVTEFCRRLVKLGVELLSSGGTSRTLNAAGIPTRDISDLTGFPEMLDGRVKTLHPLLHGGILALRDHPEHLRAMEEHGIVPVDMVVVNLYPFQEKLRAGASPEEMVELIDIGGAALLRAAAKNHAFVAAVSSPALYEKVAMELEANDCSLSPATRQMLARMAFEHTACYDAAIAAYFQELEQSGPFPEVLFLCVDKVADLRYGENPHQRAAAYRWHGGSGGLIGAPLLQGKELSYNNLCDTDASLALVREFSQPAAVIVKHASPCGAAVAPQIVLAYKRAHACDPVSAFGGVVALNREVDTETAQEIASTFIEVVAAPSFSSDALAILAKKKNMRLLAVPPSSPQPTLFRQAAGGFVVQEPDAEVLDERALAIATATQPTPHQMEDLKFAWIVAKHVKSNAMVLAKGGATVGIGAGQPNRVGALRIAAQVAGVRAQGAVLASDGFLPFADSVEVAAEHGVSALIQPGGSVRDAEVFAAAERLGIPMVITKMRHFLH